MSARGGVFISYASVDRRRVEPIVEDLQARGISCWFDRKELKPFDSELTKRISEGIANTAVTMGFVSAAYQDSDACRWELLSTLKHSDLRGLFLIRLEDCPNQWSILQENVFCDLSRDNVSVADLVETLDPPIRERPVRDSPALHAPWWPQDWASNAFEGRFDQRLRLISMLTPHIADSNDHGRQNRQVQIVGLGGQGKTMLALQVASDLSGRYPGGVARFNAGGDVEGGVVDTPESTLGRLLGQIHDWASWAAQRSGSEVTLPDRSDKDVWSRTRDAVRPLAQGTLWLIDDLPAGLDDSALNLILCPSPGDTLITTRTDAYKPALRHTTLTLDAFSPEEAVYLLSGGSAAEIEHDGAVLGTIAQTVGHHALALAVLAARLEAWSPQEVLNDLRNAPVDQLEDCARDVSGLPAGHGPSVVATLRMSVESLRRPAALDIVRLASMWPPGTPIPMDLLRHAIGATAAGGATELVSANLAQKEGPSALRVHAILASVSAWLIKNEPDSALVDDARHRWLLSKTAGWLEPMVRGNDLWDASDASRTAWHLLEPVATDWTNSERSTAFFSLMAMARLPMRHKPAGLNGGALTDHLDDAVGWAQRAESLFTESTKRDALYRGSALAMEGLLRMSLAEFVTDFEVRRDHATRGRLLLDQSVQLREPWLIDSGDPQDQDMLEKAYFNYGRLVTLAKVLAAAGDHESAVETLDQAQASYVRIGGLRAARVESDVDSEAPEKLASCLRGEAIVALTRVTHQVNLDRETRVALLLRATRRLSSAMELTCKAAEGQDNATPDMCKDVALAIKIDIVRRLVTQSRDTDVRTLVEALKGEIEDTPVPWTASDPDTMVDAAVGFARLRIASQRGGRGTTAETVASELIEKDCPALLRTLGLNT